MSNFLIAKIFTMLISYGVSTEDFNKSIIVPIPKNKSKLLSDSINYHGIALNATISKLFEYVLLESMLPKIQENNYQFSFKSRNFSYILTTPKVSLFVLKVTISQFE